MKYTGLKIMLHHGHFLAVVIPQENAEEMISSWRKGTLAEIVEGTCKAIESQGVYNPEWKWAFRASDVCGMHTCPLTDQPKVADGNLPPWYNRSGN